MSIAKHDSPADEPAPSAEPAPLSRRRLLSGVGLGLAATPMLSALATPAEAQGGRPARGAMRGRSAVHAGNKRLVANFLRDMETGEAAAVLARHCHADCVFEVFHPFNTLKGLAAAEATFWAPLKASFPDYENRIAFTIAGEYEGRDQVSTWGHVIGTFDHPWIGIPATEGRVTQRFGFTAIVRDGKIAKAYILLDVVDVMRQAGFHPFRPSPGDEEAWAFPPQDTGATALGYDPVQGAESLRIIREMQSGLLTPAQIKLVAEGKVAGNHSPHWHVNMNWYGPTGVGSMRGRRGFRDFHGALFVQAFPDRGGFPRADGGPQDAPGHYVRLGDGRYAVTGGYPSLRGTHLGGEWLGLPPTGRKVTMRVADWYRLDENNKIIDNWVLIDIPDIVAQMGMDLFHDLKFRVDRGLLRTPLPAGKMN